MVATESLELKGRKAKPEKVYEESWKILNILLLFQTEIYVG
jgi:hypothetical protein